MPLPSFLTRKKPSPTPERRSAPPADDATAVQAARTRARRRLIGAAVLLAAGVVGFPIVFDTQPRPVSVDLPIELGAGVASAPAAPRSGRATGVVVADAPVDGEAAQPARPAPEAAAEVVEAPRPSPPVEAAPEPAARPAVAASAARPASAPAVRPEPAVTLARPLPPANAASAADAERAKALLAGASAPKAPRFVVQVGAFADAAALNQARTRADKTGMKTYTQVVDTSAGKRTRLRVGPFDSRDAADRAAAKLKSAGLPAAVLTL